MESVGQIYRAIRGPLLLIGLPLATVHGYLVRDAPLFQYPEFARIFFWHFPCPIMSTFFLFAGAYFSWRYLSTRDQKWDVRSEAAHELAIIFITLTMITGVFFSRIQWGAYWQSDPRQTSFLLVLCMYFAYFVLRTAFTDPEKRATNSSGYAIAAILPFFFLTYVYPNLPSVATFHPQGTIMKGNLKGGYFYAWIEILTLVTMATHWVYSVRVRSALLNLAVNNYGNLQIAHGSAADSPVVRPLSVSDES